MIKNFTFFLLLITTCSPILAQEFIMDIRDSSTYEVVKIGQLFWFKTNLKFYTTTSWCNQFPDSEACQKGNYYYATDLINVCPTNWRVPTWSEYKRAIKEIEESYKLGDSVRYIEGKLPSKKFNLEAEHIVGITLIGDSTFFDMASTGWIQGTKWEPQNNQTTMWIVQNISNNPQPHVHIRTNEIIMHSHEHNVFDKPKKIRRFSVRCVTDIN